MGAVEKVRNKSRQYRRHLRANVGGKEHKASAKSSQLFPGIAITQTMNSEIQPPEPPREQLPGPPRTPRLPSWRAAAALAAAMLGVGVAVGAAIGPAPASSAGAQNAVEKSLPAILAELRARSAAAAAAATAATTTQAAEAASEEPVRKRRRKRHKKSSIASSTATSTESAAGEKEASKPKSGGGSTKTRKLPAIGSVWLIELSGTSLTEALAQPAAAPYIGQLSSQGTVLTGWSAAAAGAFASEAVLAEPVAEGATPPLLHSIVQPPCPEGAAGASCAAGAGQLTAADEFLKAAIAQITAAPAYREAGVVVITFATVGLASQEGLPAGSSSATLTYRPPAGALILSPFAKAGLHSSATFNPTSPRQSLEKLLH